MLLNYTLEKNKNKPFIVLLHGLFGDKNNLRALGNFLLDDFSYLLIDLRNHGASNHADDMNYNLMANDLRETVLDLNITNFHLLGHSMGAKVAMQFALLFPDFIDKLILADIAPITYKDNHKNVFLAYDSIFKKLPIKTRFDLDLYLKEFIENASFRMFLLKNFIKKKDGFEFRINYQTIKKNYQNILCFSPFKNHYKKEALFIKGENSNYINLESQKTIKKFFPKSTLKTIDKAGHFLHIEQAKAFNLLIKNYLKNNC